MADNIFHKLDYGHEDIEKLLDKVSKGFVLTEKEYRFLKELMGASDNESSEEEVAPIDPDDFVTKDEIKDYVSNSLNQIGVVTKQDLSNLQDDMSTLHSQDIEKLRMELLSKISEVVNTEIGELEEYIEDILGQVDGDNGGNDNSQPNPDNPDNPGSSVEIPSDLLDRIDALEAGYTDLKEVVDNFDFDPTIIDPVAIDERFKKLENMLDKPASYTRPTASISASPATIESGVATSITISPMFAKNDAGDMISCVVEGSSSGNRDNLDSFSETITLAHNATVTYKVTVSYGEGPTKLTQMGNVDTNNIKAGSVSATASVRALAASYHGVISGATLSESDIPTLSKSIRSSKGSTVTFDLNNQRSVYMYPSDFGAISSIKDANGFDYIDSYALSTMTYNDVVYNVYVMKDPSTITGFKQTFN